MGLGCLRGGLCRLPVLAVTPSAVNTDPVCQSGVRRKRLYDRREIASGDPRILISAKPETNNYEISRRHDGYDLLVIAEHEICALRHRGLTGLLCLRKLEPDMRPVVSGRNALSRCQAEYQPALGKKAPSLPDAVMQEQEAQPSPVACRGVHKRGTDEVASLIRFEHRTLHAQRLKQPLARKSQIVPLVGKALAENSGDDI